MSPHIKTTTHGPFAVSGVNTVRPMKPVESEKGEPMTWRPGPPIDGLDDQIYLCRCGASENKPFCDGSHADTEWDSSDGYPEGSMSTERAGSLQGVELTVLDDKMLCMHAGFCGTDRTSVWEMIENTDDTGVRATVIRMVEKCPSGRLTNVIDGEAIEPSLPVEIGVVPDGPLWVTGGVRVSLEGGETEMDVRNRVTLCRCGASSLKPLCDGSHKEIGFSHQL